MMYCAIHGIEAVCPGTTSILERGVNVGIQMFMIGASRVVDPSTAKEVEGK